MEGGNALPASETLNRLNSCFLSSVISHALNARNHRRLLEARFPNSFLLSPATVDEMETTLSGLRDTTAAGYDGIKARAEKFVSRLINVPPSHVARPSYYGKRFPQRKKVARARVAIGTCECSLRLT